MAYKHRDVVIAWMDGEIIQIQDGEGQWTDLLTANHFQRLPAFYEDNCYRIKPKPVMIRHARLHAALLVYAKNYNEQEDKVSKDAEHDPDIIWLDDWHEASFSAPKN